jgi:uncharacterized protein (UPF0216 family)
VFVPYVDFIDHLPVILNIDQNLDDSVVVTDTTMYAVINKAFDQKQDVI